MSTELDTLVQEDQLLNSLILAAQALYCFDYCLTFTSEVTYVWSRKFSLASILFYVFRYSALLNTVFVVLGFLSWPSWQTQKRFKYLCVITIRFEMAGDILILVSSAIFTAMRMYALFHNSKLLSVVILALGLVNPAISLYTFVYSEPVLYAFTPIYQTCDIVTANVNNIWMIGARASSVVFDGIVLALTWKGTKRAATLPGGSNMVLMEDTAIYFGFLFALNVLGIGIALAHYTYIEVVSTWTAVLTAVFLSRLMLDLRAVVSFDPGSELDEFSSVSISSAFEPLTFASHSRSGSEDSTELAGLGHNDNLYPGMA